MPVKALCDCEMCGVRRKWQDRWDQQRFVSIQRVLECHALGAGVIALKDKKHERLEALHALAALSELQRELVMLRTEVP